MICALFVSVFTNTMVNVAIPLIRDQFGASEAQSGWVITGYALAFAVSIPLYGRVSDLFSLRRTFAFGLGVLAVGLAVCALAPSLTVLVAGRALQGAGAGAILSPFAGRLSDRLGTRAVLFVGLAFMLVSALVISSFAAGAAPYIVAGGLLLLGIGYAGTNSPAANAASEAIPREVAGTGLGIYQLFFFLGSGSGPAVLGAFLASRRTGSGGAINPLYSLQSTPFSDAFLLTSLAVTLALLASTTLDGKPKGQGSK
ncbi:hypothetical protein BH18ACT11_BH18ACT11_00420 [soil metagenome]